MKQLIPLEPAAKAVCVENSVPPLIFQLPPEEGREVLNKAQDMPVFKCPAAISSLRLNTGRWGTVPIHVIIPDNLTGTPNLIYHIHGGGWVFGNLHTHDKLIRELASRTNSILVFPEYTLSPEVKYPTAVEQCYTALCELPRILKSLDLTCRFDTLTVSGDSVGGNMATVMTLLAKYRRGPFIHKQLLFYPVTNACFNTCTYEQFATDYYLYREGMIWFWNQYAPCLEGREEVTASPLMATAEQLSGLPAAMIINGEADVLRDEGQAYAKQLLCAGVDVTAVQIQATIHDFVMLNALDQTNACRTAMDVSTAWINRRNC